MKKRFLSFALVLALLFCGCSDPVSYKNHDSSVPDSMQVDQSIKVQRVEIPTSEVAALEDTSEVDPADDSLHSEEETTMDSAQVPVYSVEEETASDMEDGTTPDAGESEAQPSSAEEEKDSTVSLPQEPVDTLEEQKDFPCEINTYVMHTVYQTETGEDMLDLCIQMPVIEPEVSESEQLFNHYFSEKSIAYALYMQETVCPELQAQWENTEDESLSFADLNYNISYQDDGYLCVVLSYQKDFFHDYRERMEAVLFDMDRAMLVEEWAPESEPTVEEIFERISAAYEIFSEKADAASEV